jgi:hypothetical protein
MPCQKIHTMQYTYILNYAGTPDWLASVTTDVICQIHDMSKQTSNARLHVKCVYIVVYRL